MSPDQPALPAAGRLRSPRSLAALGLAIAASAALLAMAAGWGSRFGAWHFRTGFTLLRWAAYLGVAAALLSLVALLLPRGRTLRRNGAALAGLVTGVATFMIPWQGRQTARTVPAIHDITTDTENPPPFVAVLPLRAQDQASNPPEYAGPAVAAEQKAAYPDIQPLALDLPPQAAFEHALAAAREMDWDIVDSNLAQGRIEATDQTFWFGFKDDVVIRVVPAGGGARVDVRSKSRVGGSDVGANAARIRDYLERLRAAAGVG